MVQGLNCTPYPCCCPLFALLLHCVLYNNAMHSLSQPLLLWYHTPHSRSACPRRTCCCSRATTPRQTCCRARTLASCSRCGRWIIAELSVTHYVQVSGEGGAAGDPGGAGPGQRGAAVGGGGAAGGRRAGGGQPAHPHAVRGCACG